MSAVRRFLALASFAVVGVVGTVGVSAQPDPEGESIFPDTFDLGDVCAWDDVVGWPADGFNSEATPYGLPSVTDCDAPPTQRSSALHGRSDVDWLRVSITDSIGCITDPNFENSSLDGARLCVFAVCESGSEIFSCASGATPAISPDGRTGCCATGGPIFGDFDCSSGSTNSTFWMRLDQSPSACASYSLAGHF